MVSRNLKEQEQGERVQRREYREKSAKKREEEAGNLGSGEKKRVLGYVNDSEEVDLALESENTLCRFYGKTIHPQKCYYKYNCNCKCKFQLLNYITQLNYNSKQISIYTFSTI